MKKNIIALTVILAIAFCVRFCDSGDVSLAWNPSASEGVAGYKVYYGNSSRSYISSQTIGNLTAYTVTDLPDGEYFFAVTAFDGAGNESSFSNEVSTIIGSAAVEIPGNLTIPSLWVSGPLPIDITGTTIKLSWKTSVPCTSRIEYQYAGGTFSALTVDTHPVTDHFVRLTGLQPGTVYTYEVFNTDSEEVLAVAKGSFRTK